MSDPVSEIRKAAGLFELPHRGLVEVCGEDATRWLNGMLSNDIQALEEAGPGAGCYALLLNHRAGIIADLVVLRRSEGYWLELERSAIAGVLTHLDKYIVADDVALQEISPPWTRLGLEGPAASEILAKALGHGVEELPRSRCATEWKLSEAGEPAVAAAWGWSGEAAYQFFVPEGQEGALREKLSAASGDVPCIDGDLSALEVMRIEAGIARLGSELAEDVLPDEAHLDEAISETKGCYTGQEIVARLRSRGQVNHLLVGLRFPGDSLPAPGDELHDETRRVGEVTSVAHSPAAGAIGLGFVRRACAEPGTQLSVTGLRADVVALPQRSPASS